jgi:hypothetical protein
MRDCIACKNGTSCACAEALGGHHLGERTPSYGTLAKTRRMIQRLPRPCQELPFASHGVRPWWQARLIRLQGGARTACCARSVRCRQVRDKYRPAGANPHRLQTSDASSGQPHTSSHADTLHPIIPPVVARQPLSCAGTRATGSAFCRARHDEVETCQRAVPCAREARAIARSGAGVALAPETVGVFGA